MPLDRFINSLPGFKYLSKPEWHGEPGYLHYKANYQLLVDSRADFNRMAYVHANSGVYNMTPADHSGQDESARVMVSIQHGNWVLEPLGK
ncbi:MAG: hypothetical protein EPN76_06950 [Burkholderiaceae bacterium]|nr:MAG: hypothetical protein EPN76_06950 [Burkholderiaceae bacterium]